MAVPHNSILSDQEQKKYFLTEKLHDFFTKTWPFFGACFVVMLSVCLSVSFLLFFLRKDCDFILSMYFSISTQCLA